MVLQRSSDDLRQLDEDLRDWERIYTQRWFTVPGLVRHRIILKYGSFRREVIWPLSSGEVDDAIRRLHLPKGVTVRWEPVKEVLLSAASRTRR
jgi:hypothetical protein